MSLCPLCGDPAALDKTLCAHHITIDSAWCLNNRAMNDLLMRGKDLPRVSLDERAAGDF